MSHSDTDDDIPNADECENRCQEFAKVTGTDSALAMFYLQDRRWDVQLALNAYFESSVPKETDAKGGTSTATIDDDVEIIDPEPHRIRLLSWNIDGLDPLNVKTRAKAVAKVILQENPDVVFIQELVGVGQEVLEAKCPQYQLIPGGKEGYYTAIMLKASSCTLQAHTLVPFYSSTMARNLIKVEASVKDVNVVLMTSHLESCKEHSKERKKQLSLAFKEMSSAGPDKTVIFGGDLNLRDKEVDEVGGLPANVRDLWEVTGKRQEAKFTWDMQRNDNKEFPGKFKPRCRFDRLYMKNSQGGAQLKPVYFELAGIQRITNCGQFPSDHWGLLAHFDKT